jgi:phage terminase Nu1 subunit (DNA packaging protein)
MSERLTRDQVAELYGVASVTVDAWTARGLPTVPPEIGGRPGRETRARRSWRISRRALAASWDVHPDTLSKWMAEGLGAAIVDRGRKGEVWLDLRLATRWREAAEGRLERLVLDDFKACAAAGVAAVHALSPLYARRETEEE